MAAFYIAPNYDLDFTATLPLWADWLSPPKANGSHSKGYWITATYDRYRDRYFAQPGKQDQAFSSEQRVNKVDVLAGLTRLMPPEDAAKCFIADVNWWYLRILSALLGGRYKDYASLQPKAIGFLDDPVHKKPTGKQKSKRLPGDDFTHVHFAMVILDAHCPHKRGIGTVEEFERLHANGKLEEIWKRRNPSGALCIKELYDAHGALDYAAKSAKRSSVYRENMIMLPFKH